MGEYVVHVWRTSAEGLPEYLCGIDPEAVHARVSEARFQRFPLDVICDECLRVLASQFRLTTDRNNSPAAQPPVTDEELCDELASALRLEGFDAKKHVINGELGVLIGPKGLNPLRMPPGQRTLFFPHQELTERANRPLLARRDFHRIFENRKAHGTSAAPLPSRHEK